MADTLDTEELREAIRGVLADRHGDAFDVPGEEGRGFDEALWREMAALGWLGMAVSEAQGGLQLGPEHLAVLYEELGRELASVPILQTMIAAQLIGARGNAACRERWLAAIASGECRVALALPNGQGEVWIGADQRISGELDHVAFADVATLFLVPAFAANGESCLALVPATLEGVAVEAHPVVDLTRSMGRVTLEKVAPDTGAILQMTPAAWAALADHAAVGMACDAVGGAAALLDRTIDYLKVREQFGRPIGSFQSLKHRVADWKVEIEAAAALTRHAAALLAADGEDASAVASEAKAYTGDLYARFAGDAVQLHGGIGFTWEHPCHIFLKRAKLGQQLFGSSTSHRERAARLLFVEPTEADVASQSEHD